MIINIIIAFVVINFIIGINSLFSCTDIDESKLIDTKVTNSTFVHNKTGCQITFDHDYSAYWVYFVNFLGTLAVLPGNIVSALLMDKTGRLSMLGKIAAYLGFLFFLHFQHNIHISTP